ncbi:MAG: hypothetical protein ACOX7F_04030 [Eubacteriales bacterium]
MENPKRGELFVCRAAGTVFHSGGDGSEVEVILCGWKDIFSGCMSLPVFHLPWFYYTSEM